MFYYHGSAQAKAVVEAAKNGDILNGFHLTPDPMVAKNYAGGNGHVIRFEIRKDVKGARIGKINKNGNYNANVGNGVEVVLETNESVNSFVDNITGIDVEWVNRPGNWINVH